MRLRRWCTIALIIFSLIATPAMVGTSLFKAGYGFTELLEPTSGGFDWMKNPVGKPIRNYATGVRANVFHLVEVVDHWDLAGEVVLDWEHKIVFPFAYFHDIFAGNYKIVLSPTTKKDSEEGATIIMSRVDTEKAAKLGVILMWAKLKGMFFEIEEDTSEPVRQASLER